MMASSIIKKLIGGVFLLVLCFLLGSYAVSSTAKVIFIMAFFVCLLAINSLGRRSWVLVFLLPYALNQLPVEGLSKMAPGYILSFLVLLYFVVLALMGYLRLQWRRLWYFDALIGLILFAFVVQYLRHPVGMTGLGAINGMIGGRDYLLVLFATLFYVTLSLVPLEKRLLKRTLQLTLLVIVAQTLLTTAYELKSGMGASEYLEEATTSRFGGLAALGNILFVLMLAFQSPVRLLLSPPKLAILLLGLGMVLLSGFREQLGRLGFVFASAALLYRQFYLFILLGLVAYGSLFYISQSQLILSLPYGIQRALSIVPGVEVDSAARKDADYSVEWREEMWGWAMDPQEGYIKDYIWGDGYGQSLELMRLNAIQRNRGRSDVTGRDVFADTGVWHNGPIHMIHRMGYVGLGLMTLLMLSFCLLAFRVCVMYRRHELFPYLMFLLLPLPADCLLFYASAGTTLKILGLYYYFGIAKLFYCLMRDGEEGAALSAPYVPLMLRREGPF